MNNKIDSEDAIRLLIVHAQATSHDCGGSFGVLNYFLKGVDHNRFDVQVVLSLLDKQRPEPDSPVVRYVRDWGAKSHFLYVPMNQRRADIVFLSKYFVHLAFSVWKLFRLVRRERIDIVYTNSLNILASGLAARMAGVKSIYHIHEIVRKPRVVAKALVRVVGMLADTLICVSEAVKAPFLEVGVPENKLVTVPNCIDLDRFAISYTGRKVRREFAPGGDEKLVASVGRIVPKKGHQHVVEAAKMVLDKFPSARFLIVGASRTEEDNYLQLLIEQVKRNGLQDRVIFTGPRDDMPELLAGVDVAVLAAASHSTPEASPLVVLEALAMGTPVVASNLGGIPEVLHDGKTGYLVPPCDSEALAHAILRLLQHEQTAQEMGRVGQAWVRKHFHVGSYSARIQDVVLNSNNSLRRSNRLT